MATALETDVVLRDGSTARVRAVQPSDARALRDFLAELSEESRRLRYFSGGVNVERAAHHAVDVDGDERFGVVALQAGRVIAHAEYARFGDEGWAEASFMVADRFQGQGLATTMLAHLAGVAESAGVHFFQAEVLAENHRMVGVFRDSGFAVRTRSEPGEIIVEFPTTLSPGAVERFELRERHAAVAALRSVLAPASVAVIGASTEAGAAILRNLVAEGFKGPVYQGLSEAPGPVELAVITVEADMVLDAARACAGAGVRALVVTSAGFAEAPGDGPERQLELLRICREAGMRLVGPNCQGVLNTAPDVRLDASFAKALPRPGEVGFMSQSGALALAAIEYGLGISSMVSAGNKGDISGNDLIQYWEEDPGTRVMLLYLESFGNPRKFARIARRAARSKPILAVKSGRRGAGTHAATSSTAALLAASDLTVDALFHQAGVIRADTLTELLDVAHLLESQEAPHGPRVAIVTNTSGPAALCADACAAAGLEVAEVRRLDPATPRDYSQALRAIADSGDADALVAIFIPPAVGDPGDVAGAIAEASGSVPLLAVLMSQVNAPPTLERDGKHVPVYAFPENAAAALGHAVRYRRWCARDPGRKVAFEDVDGDEAAGVIAAALRDGPGWLDDAAVARLLACYGLRMNPGGSGVEMIVGVVTDPLFGPVVACGGGGTTAELIGDAAVRITPLTDSDAHEMVRSLQTFPLLEGYRGAPRADVAALEDAILRVAAMVEGHPEIAELDLNPAVVGADGLTVGRARVRVQPPPPRRLWPSVD
jgi:acyl-CoA synthetase (NDP forming)/RimJ/RimL family protein N-acetyltransferase